VPFGELLVAFLSRHSFRWITLTSRQLLLYTFPPTRISTLVRSSAIFSKQHGDVAFCYLSTDP
jgi:hypothetical protein